MKNKNLLLFFTIFFFSFFLKNLLANEFSFDANEINILDNGKIIEAINGTAISSDKKILIDAKKFYYNKKNLTLEAFGNVKVNDV